MGLQGVIGACRELYWFTRGYSIQWVTVGYKGLEWVTTRN